MSPNVIAVATAFLLIAGSAEAGILHYGAVLKGANESPPNASRGHGEVSAMLDTDRHELDYTITFENLSGPPTTADFQAHGAASAAVAVEIPQRGDEIHAIVKLTDDQIAQLNAGRWSFNISTMANPGGEIGGELKREAGAY